MAKTTLRDTIVAKSDQLNADDLIAGPITVRVTGVQIFDNNSDQPVAVSIEGHKPYKPCKGMRRLLISQWGDEESQWIGQSMTLFRNPDVKYAGKKTGGIQVSHLTNLKDDNGNPVDYTTFMLTMSRNQPRQEIIVNRLEIPVDAPVARKVTPADVANLRKALSAKSMTDEQIDAWISEELSCDPSYHADAANWTEKDLEACRAKYKRDFSSKEGN